MTAIEYALVQRVAAQEGGLQPMLDELARRGALDTFHDQESGRTFYSPRPREVLECLPR